MIVWYNDYISVLKDAKERHAMKEVMDAIVKGNIYESVHPHPSVYSQNQFYIPIKCIHLV